MANICVFCDGTWQTDEDEENGVLTVSNVAKMRNTLALGDAGGEAQKRYYHPGVGTGGGRLSRLIGGGFGVGLQDNVKSAYKWLSVTYEPGDRIHLFGFSRGAFTVRTLAGRPVHAVSLLGHNAPLAFRHSSDGLEIDLPATPPCDYAYTFKIELG